MQQETNINNWKQNVKDYINNKKVQDHNMFNLTLIHYINQEG